MSKRFKRCNGAVLPASEFYHPRSSECKECEKAKKRLKYRADAAEADKIRARNRMYHAANRERIKRKCAERNQRYRAERLAAALDKLIGKKKTT